MRDLVIADSGYGILCLKCKGDSGLISGFLDKSVFFSDEMAEAAVGFLEQLLPACRGGYVVWHVDFVKLVNCVEYRECVYETII